MKIKQIFSWIMLPVITLIFVAVSFLLFAFIQEKLLVPKDYILWIFKYPISRLGFVFILEFVILFSTIILFRASGYFRHKKWFYPVVGFINVLLVYVLLFNVCVVTNDKLINRSFLFPQGRTYNYCDIVSIDTGVYAEEKWHFPFADQSGEFYYIITLIDGMKINLSGYTSGTRNDKEINGVFEDIDRSFVKMGIKKTANINNFGLLEESMDKIYSDKIKRILTKVK